MNDKYYTPELEAFHIGFEYEWKCDSTKTPWTKSIMTNENGPVKDPDAWRSNDYRIKYLDREDIESLGWIREEFPMARRLFFTKEVDRFGVKETYSLLYAPQTSWVLIYKTEGYVIEHPDKITTTGTTVFAGEIKNKSELKRILKQVKL